MDSDLKQNLPMSEGGPVTAPPNYAGIPLHTISQPPTEVVSRVVQPPSTELQSNQEVHALNDEDPYKLTEYMTELTGEKERLDSLLGLLGTPAGRKTATSLIELSLKRLNINPDQVRNQQSMQIKQTPLTPPSGNPFSTTPKSES